MAGNDLAAAETLVSQAENLQISYSPLYFGDTPQKARQDLERRKAAALTSTRPSQIYTPYTQSPMPPATPPGAANFAVPASRQ